MSSRNNIEISERRRKITYYFMMLNTSICMSYNYNSLYEDKRPCTTSRNTGDKWVRELFDGHPARFHSNFRMSKPIFLDLLEILVSSHGLEGSRRITAKEILAITIYIMAHNRSMRECMERFQHSTETISRYFSRGLASLISLSEDIISPVDDQFIDIPAKILNDDRYMPYFKDCIGAIDGTHVDARIPVDEQVPYIGRHGCPTQNVMAVCDFDMTFTFVMAGWEGSAHDSRIFQIATTDRKWNFPHPPPGKYYLVDAGYPLQLGYIKPYADTRYHLPDFARGHRPIQGRKETFNQAHSSLRSVIERTFGVWKKKWKILRDMPSYSFKKQRNIVLSTMTLHNFIRRHRSRADEDFYRCDDDETFIHPQARLIRRGVQMAASTRREDNESTRDARSRSSQMAALRDSIADQIYEATGH